MNKLLAKASALTLLGLCLLLPSLQAAKTAVMYKDQVAVIVYHHIDDDAKSGGTITTKLFKDQLQYLKGKGYQFITLKQFKAFMNGSMVPNNAVLVTFDDGYESFYTNAYPVLKSMRIPAVNFIITGDLDNPLASYIPSMSRDEIIEMTSDTNFIDAQCHTNSFHYKLADGNAALIGRMTTDGRKETDEEYKRRVASDTKACISKLSELYPEDIDSYAYPYGIFDKNAVGYIQQEGIKFAFTVVPEMTTRQLDPMQLPRINAGSSFITPEGLHNAIQRRIVSLAPPAGDVPLAETMIQLGGNAVISADGKVTIQYQQLSWIGASGSSKLTAADGRTLTLSKPLSGKGKQILIALQDLEQAIGFGIVYNPSVQSFSVQQTPSVRR
ncbi:polysaccharide deacetylase family protein [Paenibacillus filicis]|uniref:Polysaccharide deacetylase family protein n=1 Tax=Paenibacillus gyeongsangnamensis TaxID=3388067 RepID=A0ABT4Q967_9BACL|nr:polysaccharide deacetylase family protein [Paenibacillus filicis]MCZ8513408.1 polysaccharide deacetylase family protein [Paenibacillus filicis]